MINRLIEFSVRNKLIIALLTLFLIALGVYNFLRLPIDAVPDITNNQVQVITISSSLSPQEVEQFITFPVEVSMANIQGVNEIRSISRFGLSVVTIVFEDRMDIHLARQLVGEQIAIASQEIPEGYGIPEMMPITTGLGEIYQYVLVPEKGYEKAWTPMEIRTVQDWIVKRQLSGIPGIVEISSFGGLLKQYEISLVPRELVSMNVTLAEVYEAVSSNNANSGGSYIQKGPNAHYIRAEGMFSSMEDIERVLIKEVNGQPVYLRDIAQINLGSPPRYGAMTMDGKGEAVGGITLMLKGANTSETINNVKERISRIERILPEGLKIEPYLDRSRLIEKTTHTVRNNLMEGGLIVIFILILLLGSYRSGIIVASVIPLSMLFAFIMMNLFNVSANLMSLGAIDFGLIVDGAVIVVEGIVYVLHRTFQNQTLSRSEMDRQIIQATGRVGRSATFGVIIILIVYLPILAFQGIEGKTFRPMAMTVSFALLGALILSLTYVPMISALFLSRKIRSRKTTADRIVRFLNASHGPVLEWAIRNKRFVLILTLVMVVGTLFSFRRLGGEFLPTLEEGDLAAQMTISPGSSLEESIATTTKAEQIILDEFPEVVSVVSKIGTAEVPTDPMAVEDADIMIILKDKKDWVSAKTREELAGKMKESLEVIPGASFDFSQPIQLRFNELMTGVKADVAIKLYGEELDVLFDKGKEVAARIQSIQGAGDVRVEQITGLPQLVVRYNRELLARYGLNIEDVNRTIRTAFAGEKAGIVVEGERRFDLVIRLAKNYREDINALKRLQISKPGGELILLSQVADVIQEKGPLQISRDNTQRRIVIGVNVRNRDVESFVREAQSILERDIRLPAGYYFTYGGQFENLQSAKRSSAIAVPISLILIFILLYFAFHSLKEAVMIYTAVPVAAMGGIWALHLRGMPFSISAGVGFIALFGIVVLNGIVLISYYKQLESEGVTDIFTRVREGTRMRLRPVILTASTDALGFLPMAISTAAGAEVQKPLATVVIGGLITATFLTLVILPLVYILFNKGFKGHSEKKIPRSAGLSVLFLFLFVPMTAQNPANSRKITVEQAVEMGLNNYPGIENYRLRSAQGKEALKGAFNLPGPEVSLQFGQINSAIKDRHFTVEQAFELPQAYVLRKNLIREQWVLRQYQEEMAKAEHAYQIRTSYSEWLYQLRMTRLAMQKDSLFRIITQAIAVREKTGEIGMLDYDLAMTTWARLQRQLEEQKIRYDASYRQLSYYLMSADSLMPEKEEIPRYTLAIGSRPDSLGSLTYQILDQTIAIATARYQESINRFFPDVSLGYFEQTIDGSGGFRGWQIGLQVPLWFWTATSERKIQKAEIEIQQNSKAMRIREGIASLEQELHQLRRLQSVINTYEKEGLLRADRILNQAYESYRNGNISLFELVQLQDRGYEEYELYYGYRNSWNQSIEKINLISYTGDE